MAEGQRAATSLQVVAETVSMTNGSAIIWAKSPAPLLHAGHQNAVRAAGQDSSCAGRWPAVRRWQRAGPTVGRPSKHGANIGRNRSRACPVDLRGLVL